MGAHLGKPTYVWPYALKRAVREAIPGDYVDRPDPTHEGVSSKFLNFLWCSGDKKKIHINNGFENRIKFIVIFSLSPQEKEKDIFLRRN